MTISTTDFNPATPAADDEKIAAVIKHFDRLLFPHVRRTEPAGSGFFSGNGRIFNHQDPMEDIGFVEITGRVPQSTPIGGTPKTQRNTPTR